jgi:hypothetical protein
MSRFKYSVLGLVSILAVSISFVTNAEEAPPTGFSIFSVEIKPGSQGQFEEFIVKFKQAADLVGTVPTWFASSPGVGQDNIYTFATPFKSFGELAEQRPILQEVYEAAEVTRLLALYQDAVVSTQTYLMHPRPDLSRSAPPRESPAEISLTVGITVNSGMVPEWEEYVKKLIEATDQTAKDAYWNAYAPGFGATPRSFAVRILMNWVDLDIPNKPFPERLNEAFGKREGAKIFAAGEASVANIEYAIRRNRVDLSHIATQ